MEQLPQKINKAEHLAEMPAFFEHVRENVLNNFESRTEGLDIERINGFMRERGLNSGDIIFFYDEDLPKLKELFVFSDIGIFSESYPGKYFTELDIVLVRRDRESEKLNGSAISEGNAVHEMAHSANSFKEYTAVQQDVTRLRHGFTTKKISQKSDGSPFLVKAEGQDPCAAWRGVFLEEAFAEMCRGEYLDAYILPETQEEIAELADMRMLTLRDKNEISFGREKGKICRIGLKYASLTQGDSISINIPSIGATALEKLCKKVPELRQCLMKARTDIESLREIPKLIEKVKPGLYGEIQKCGYSQDEFIRVQNIIKEAIQSS